VRSSQRVSVQIAQLRRYFNLNFKALATQKSGAGDRRRAPAARSAVNQEAALRPFDIDRAAHIFFNLSLPRLSAKFWNVQAFRTVLCSVTRRPKQTSFPPDSVLIDSKI
jgi:hypothetical protein